MSETRLAVGSTQAAVRVVLRNIGVRRGVGVARFMLTFEVASKQQAVADCPLWLGGRVEVLERQGHVQPYLAAFQPQVQLLSLPQLGVDQTLQLTLEASDRQLQLIEENRSAGGIHLEIYLSGYAIQDAQHVPVGESSISHQISHSDWISLLQQAGYHWVLLLELEAPDPHAHPDLAEAIDYFAQAQHRYLDGEWRLTVESLRQSLASLVGKKADDEEQEEGVVASHRERLVSWGQLRCGSAAVRLLGGGSSAGGVLQRKQNPQIGATFRLCRSCPCHVGGSRGGDVGSGV